LQLGNFKALKLLIAKSVLAEVVTIEDVDYFSQKLLNETGVNLDDE